MYHTCMQVICCLLMNSSHVHHISGVIVCSICSSTVLEAIVAEARTICIQRVSRDRTAMSVEAEVRRYESRMCIYIYI